MRCVHIIIKIHIYIYSWRRIRESRRNFDNRFICIQRDGSEPRHTCAYTCPIYIRVCVVEEKKGRTPSAKHLLRPPLLNDFTHCASKYQPLVFRGSLCRDNLNIKATMVNVTGIYIIIHQNSISIYPRMYHISRPIVSRKILTNICETRLIIRLNCLRLDII